MTRILGVVSAKGGVGKSTVASNLGLALQKFGKSVAIIDCNLSTPHLSYYLGVSDYKATINDVLLDKIDINSAFYNYNGVKYIPASLKFEDLIGINLSDFKKHLTKIVGKKTDFIILDSAPGLGKEALSVLDASTEIVLVSTPFLPMINDVMRCKDVAKQFGDKKKMMIINMTTGKNHELKGKTIEKVIGIPVIGEISFDKSVVESVVLKMPLVEYRPNSIASIGFMKVASLLAEKDYETPLKFKVHKLKNRIRNFIFSGVQMTQDSKEIKEELTK